MVIHQDNYRVSQTINCRDMRGKLFATIPNPIRPYEYGNIVVIGKFRYVVKGICIINGKFNINFDKVTIL